MHLIIIMFVPFTVNVVVNVNVYVIFKNRAEGFSRISNPIR